MVFNKLKSTSNLKIDHIAIAVKDLEKAIALYENIYNFQLQKRRSIEGKYSGMISAEFDCGDFSTVLVQGTESESQICKYIDRYGSGVQHVAYVVDNLQKVASELASAGVEFATDLIAGDGIYQIFTKRDENTGMMFEFIERRETGGFQKNNIQQLFDQLEMSDAY